MEIITNASNVHTIHFKDEKSALFLFISDVHFDSKSCRRDLLESHLDYIKKNNGYVFCFGDWFDVMGAHRDPRSKPQHIRKEYYRDDKPYLDAIVEDSYNFLKKYADNFIFFGRGNHETNIENRHDTDILGRLAFLLNQKGNANVQVGGYSGYINVRFSIRNEMQSYLIAYHHGGGGNATRSKGVLHSQLDAMTWPDANLIVSGHDHNKIHDPSNVSYRFKHDKAQARITHHRVDWLKLGNYKRNEKNPLQAGWEVEKKFLPKDVGGYICELHYGRVMKNGVRTSFVKPKIFDTNAI